MFFITFSFFVFKCSLYWVFEWFALCLLQFFKCHRAGVWMQQRLWLHNRSIYSCLWWEQSTLFFPLSCWLLRADLRIHGTSFVCLMNILFFFLFYIYDRLSIFRFMFLCYIFLKLNVYYQLHYCIMAVKAVLGNHRRIVGFCMHH